MAACRSPPDLAIQRSLLKCVSSPTSFAFSLMFKLIVFIFQNGILSLVVFRRGQIQAVLQLGFQILRFRLRLS